MRYCATVSGPGSGTGWSGGRFEPARLRPGRRQLPRELVREHQRQRIIAAALEIFGERGLSAATVQQLVRGARVSRATFYEQFADKEACFAALQDAVLAWIRERVAAALAAEPDWSAQVRIAVQEAIRLLDEDPRLARVCAVDALHGGPAIRHRHERLIADLADGLRLGRARLAHGDDLPEILERALLSGSLYLVARSIVYGEGPAPSTLALELAELLLIPYLGPAEAHRAVRP